MKISAKRAIKKYDVSPLTLIHLVRSNTIKVYNKLEKPIDLNTHQNKFEELMSNYTPIDLTKSSEDKWKEYLNVFEFDDPNLARNIQETYENEKQQEALIKIEYNLILENYYFERNEFEDALQKLQQGVSLVKYAVTKDSNGKLVVEADSTMWEGLSPANAHKNMKDAGMPDEVIAYIFSNKMTKKINQETIGELITGRIKTNEAHKKWVNRLLKAFNDNYNPF